MYHPGNTRYEGHLDEGPLNGKGVLTLNCGE